MKEFEELKPVFEFGTLTKEDVIKEANDDLYQAEEILKSSKIILGSDLLSMKAEEIPTLLCPIFPKVGLVGLAGSSDAGKSASLRHFLFSVVTGQSDWIGFKLNQLHKKAIYVSSEDGMNSLAFLFQKLNKEYNVSPERLSGLKVITDTENLLEKLEDELQKEKVDVIVLDTFGDLYSKSMNESNQVRSFLNDFSRIAEKYQCLVIFLHHTGKKTEEFAPSKHNLLGSQGFESKMRVVVELRLDRYQTDVRHFCIVKGNYLPREYKESSYVLRMNQNFFFSATGERVSFEELAGSDDTQKKELEENILSLHESGMKQQEIAIQLGTSQSKVSRVIKKSEK